MKIFLKVVLSLLPFLICISVMLFYILTMNDILTSDGNGGVIRHSRILLQLVAWAPVLVVSLVGSGMYLATMLCRNKFFIVGAWVVAVILGAYVFVHLAWHIIVVLWVTDATNSGLMVIFNSFYNLAPFLIMLSFFFVFFLFLIDSIKRYRTLSMYNVVMKS